MKPVFYKGFATRIISIIPKEGTYILRISRTVNGTYSHIMRNITLLEEKDILTKEKIGRKAIIKLTKKGQRLKELLNEINLLTIFIC